MFKNYCSNCLVAPITADYKNVSKEDCECSCHAASGATDIQRGASIKPTVFKTDVWRDLSKELGKPPKVQITPISPMNKEDKKKARMLQKIINYMFKNNTNGFTQKYISYMKRRQREFFEQEAGIIQTSYDTLEKYVSTI